jgi:hypothetical protein
LLRLGYSKGLLLSLLFCSVWANGQVIKEKIKKIGEAPQKIRDNYLDDSTSKPNYLIYPTIAYSPETKWELGFVNLVLFYAKNNKKNRLSEINTFTFYTQQKQYGIWLDHAIYGNKDQLFFLGKVRFQYFPLRFYGIGNQSVKENYETVNSYNIQIRERVLKKVKGHFFAGIEFDYQNLYQVQFGKPKGQPISAPLGAGGSANVALGLGVVYDKRHNVLNERKGLFVELAYLNYAKYLSIDFAFQNIQFDARYFRKGIGKNQVWAVQGIGQFNHGNVPFNQLALMGGENMMRGYYTGRFRDNNLMAVQTEYRFLPFPFSKRFGGALFAAIGSVEGKVGDFTFTDIKPTAGLGLRYLVFKSKDIFLRFDAAFTGEGQGFYIFVGEAF